MQLAFSLGAPQTSLRPYQQDAVRVLWQSLVTDRHVLCVLPTGSGKTVIFTELLERAKGVKAVVLLNRGKLTEQTIKRLSHLDIGVYSAGLGSRDLSKTVTVSTIQSIYTQVIPGLKFIVADECHNLTNDGQYGQFINAHPEAKVLGFTATPFRDSGFIYGPSEFFPKVHFSRTLKQMLDEGFVVEPKAKAPKQAFDTSKLTRQAGDFRSDEIANLVDDTGKIRDQIADAMPRLVDRRKVVWICASIAHAEKVRKNIPEESSIIHSKLEDTAFQVRCFEEGPIRHMVAVAMLTEGYDYPPIDAIVLMRPTRSPKLYVQIVGRGLRPAAGKADCLVLDYGEVIKNCGPLDNPNIGAKRSSSGPTLDYLVRVCPDCDSIFAKEIKKCPDCGFEFRVERMDTTTREHTDRDIMQKVVSIEEVRDVTFHEHESKQGNRCLRIDYHTKNVFPRSEFFTNHPFSWTKAKARLKVLVEYETDHLSFDEFMAMIETYTDQVMIPNTIEIDTGGKYVRIERLGFGNRDGKRDSDLFEFT